jgi:hypothetical protein
VISFRTTSIDLNGRRVAALLPRVHPRISVAIHDVTQGKQFLPPALGKTTVSHLAFSADGGRLFGYGVDGTDAQLIVWNASDAKEQSRFQLARNRPAAFSVDEALAFSADGRTFACGGGRFLKPKALGDDQKDVDVQLAAQFWDTTTGAEKPVPVAARITPHRSLAFAPDLRRLAGVTTVAEPGVLWQHHDVHIWDTTSGHEVCRLGPPPGFMRQSFEVTFSPDGRYLAESSLHNSLPQLVVWDLDRPRVVVHVRGLRGQIGGAGARRTGVASAGMAWHPDGRLLAVATEREVRIFDIAALAADD